MNDNLLRYILFAGIALVAVGYIWLLVAAFRAGWGWGLGCLLVPPLLIVFALTHRAAAWKPSLVLVFALCLAAFSPLYSRFAPLDLGPHERIVEKERHITLTGWDRKDYGLLNGRTDTVVLQMANADVDDATLKLLEPMSLLRELDLNDTNVTNEGLTHLRSLTQLQILRLRNTKVDDVGLRESLGKLESLKMLDVKGTGITAEALKEWKSAVKGRRASR
jgi:hypothetical protein